MVARHIFPAPEPAANTRTDGAASRPPGRLATRAQCVTQLALALSDLADRDDIHQAAIRLKLVQQWILDETARAACDPIFIDRVPC